jgi:hypothetical protein
LQSDEAAHAMTSEDKMSNRSTRVVKAILGTITFYTFVGWVYIAVLAVAAPQTLRLQLTHFSPWPHEDTFGELCFATSFVTALTWQILRARHTDLPPG